MCLGLALALVPLLGADCVGTLEPSAERRECEEVCAAEASCDLGRTQEECLAALCDFAGFKIVAEPASDAGLVAHDLDLQDLSANECMRTAQDCQELLLCSCPDSCGRVDECTGSVDGACLDNCENLLAQDPALYLENRCKMESSCADLAACGVVSG